MTLPPVTGVLIRAGNMPDTLRANHSAVVFAGTGIVFEAVHPDDNSTDRTFSIPVPKGWIRALPPSNAWPNVSSELRRGARGPRRKP